MAISQMLGGSDPTDPNIQVDPAAILVTYVVARIVLAYNPANLR